jgi:hypothetical protein
MFCTLFRGENWIKLCTFFRGGNWIKFCTLLEVETISIFLQIFEMFDLFPVINSYPVIGENTLASHLSDGFLHFFLNSDGISSWISRKTYEKIFTGIIILLYTLFIFIISDEK